MTSDGTERLAFRPTAACGLVAIACMILPAPAQIRIRATMNDVLAPGQVAASSLVHQLTAAPKSANVEDSLSPDLRSRVLELELALRRQQLKEAGLREELELTRKTGVSPFLPSTSSRLLRQELLQARVLGRERDLIGSPSLLLDLGSSDGAVREAFVVHSADPVLDQGTSAGIATGQPVYAGRCVLGRITRTGRWTSAVQLTTNTQYSARAQLLRKTDAGSQFGAEGIITGLGDGTCRLTGIPYTEPVSVGDSVYTGGRSARFPEPMYYGQVVKVSMESGQRWTIIVKPHLDVDQIREVAVLRESMNTIRVLGQ